MYSCFVNSTIAQANENNHSSKIAFSPYFSLFRFFEEFEEFIHFRNTLLFCFIDCERHDIATSLFDSVIASKSGEYIGIVHS